jgi:prophage antirepressor-like protein
MEKVFGLYSHEDFGTLRTLVTDGVVLFCANDVADALGFCDPRGAVKYHCKNIEKHRHFTNGGVQTMNFTDIDDVMRLISYSKSADANLFENWLLGEVVPAIIRDAGLETPEAYDEDEEYVVKLGDFMARIYLEIALYETLECLVRGIRSLPDNDATNGLKAFAERSGELSKEAFFSSGITREFIANCNIDDISELLKNVLVSPEDAGYVVPCEGERCCDFAERIEREHGCDDDDEDFFEYDDEDNVPKTGDISAILDCCKRLLAVADSQLGKLAAE